MKPYVIAHRGAVSVAPENSAAAISAAAELGADAAEIDVQLTRDGVPVLLHDRTVNRTTDGCGPIAAMSWREVAQLRGRDGVTIPTLDDVLAIAAERGLRLAIELKHYGPEPSSELAEIVVRRLVSHGLLASCWAWSFRPGDLRNLAALAPQLTLGALSFGWPNYELQRLGDQLIPLAAHLSALWPQTVARYEPPVIAWTNDSERLARRFLSAGVAGLITNNVARIRPVVEEWGAGVGRPGANSAP